ncbi:MAG: hypothetical protein HY925_00055 [Elusimicrobia bacterium]|nr:hypothetical protein [Elusimicrobiota bacterium]
MKSSLLLVLALAVGAQEEKPRYKDTAGTYLKPVIDAVRKQYEDAELIGISGRSDNTGSALCDPKNPSSDGWIYHFYSKRYDTAALISECQGYIVGPLKEYVQTASDTPPIQGRFTDDDEALKDLLELGVSLEPRDHGASGKRPYSFSLMRVEDERHQKDPLFWQVTIGKDVYMLSATTHKVLRDVVVRYPRGADGKVDRTPPSDDIGPGGSPRPMGAASTFKVPGKPKKPKGYTAFKDLPKVKAYAKGHLPGAVLMAIDGISDAWGNIDCFGSGDGWAYYYYSPRTKTIETVYACNGEVGPGKSGYVPVSLSQHGKLPEMMPDADSDKAMDGMLSERASVLNEGMGRYYTRRAPMRLFQFKTSPLTSPELWKKTLLWEVSVGRSVYYVDATTGKFVAEKK